MKGHLFEENIDALDNILEDVEKHAKRLEEYNMPSLVEDVEIIFTDLVKAIYDLEYAIASYEEGITNDIDKTKAEILEALRRL